MIYTFEHTGDGSDPWKHVVKEGEPDATVCGEFIEPCEDGGRCDGFHSDTEREWRACTACVYLVQERVMAQARSDVARELGVDESEVF